MNLTGAGNAASLKPTKDTPTASTISLDFLDFGSRQFLAIREQGHCCCGSCIGSIDFLERRDKKIIRVTDEIWPRFPFVTKNGQADAHIRFAFSRNGKELRIHGIHYVAQKDTTLYRLRWSPKLERFVVTFRHKDLPKAYPRTETLK